MRPTMNVYKPGAPAKYAHVKLDGHFLRVAKDQFGAVKCYTNHDRAELDLSWVPSMKNVWHRVPAGTDLLGELWYPEQPASYVKTAVVAKDPLLVFHVFAIPSASYDAGLEELDNLCVLWGLHFAFYYGPIYSQSRLGLFDPANLPPMQHEGFVMKEGNMIGWAKHKEFLTADLRVVDTVDGKGQHLGLMGSLVVADSTGRIVANVGGFTREERINASVNSPIGKIIEVKYQYIGSQGKLRHPTFVRFRDDKTEADNLS